MSETITKLSANMCPRAMTALTMAAELTGDSQTDCLNRAIQLYAYVEKVKADGGRVLVEDPDGNAKPLELN